LATLFKISNDGLCASHLPVSFTLSLMSSDQITINELREGL